MEMLFIQAGGTVDKGYPSSENNHGYNFVVASPAYERILKRVNPGFRYQTMALLQKDSLDLTDEERESILRACQESTVEKIIVTHGTDTMIETAAVLSKLVGKTIVMTGALLPELFKDSDADFNLGVAVGALATLDAGVYIAMNGQVTPWDHVVFNDQAHRFELKPN